MVIFLLNSSCQLEDKQEKKQDYEESFVMDDHAQESMSLGEFMGWCREGKNRLSKEKSITDMRFSLSYLPPETMAFLELRKEDYDLPKFKKACENYFEMTYFDFRIELINGSGEILKHKLQSPSQYEARVKYTSFDLQSDIFLVQGEDTLFPGLYQFERVFEAAPYADMMLAFDNGKFDKSAEFTIVYNDKLFEKGFVKFNYKNRQLINLPTIGQL